MKTNRFSRQVYIYKNQPDLSWMEINPGEKVVLKPNLVKESVYGDMNSWQHVITSEYIIRLVSEYVAKKLEGKGEIYNHWQLRENLIKKGYTFNSKSDTETLLISWREWGKYVNSTSEKPWLEFGTEKSPLEMIKNIECESFVEFITDTSVNYFENTSDNYDFFLLTWITLQKLSIKNYL